MRRVSLLYISLALLALSCSNVTEPELTDQAKESIAKEIQNQYAELVTNLKELDVGIWSQYWNSDDFLGASSGVYYFSDFTTFKDSVAYYFSLRERQEVKPYRVDIAILGPDLALLRSGTIWNISLNNGAVIKADALASLLWQKEDEEWKIIYLHENWLDID